MARTQPIDIIHENIQKFFACMLHPNCGYLYVNLVWGITVMRHAVSILFCAGLLTLPFAASAQSTTNYSYDDLGRLKTVSSTSGTVYKTVYSYDSVDNRTAATSHAGLNGAPTCPSFTITLNPPTNNPVQLTVPYGSGCSDPDNDTLTVTSPAAPYTITVNIHTTTTLPYTVSDGQGATASGTITVVRN